MRFSCWILISFCASAASAPPAAAWTVLKHGIRYQKRVTSNQRIYITRVNLKRAEIGVRATRRANWYRKTSSFAKAYGAIVAVNGDFFSSSSTTGLAVADGKVLANDSRGQTFVALGPERQVEMQRDGGGLLAPRDVPAWFRQAVGGRPTLLWNGEVTNDAKCTSTFCGANPRTAVGLTQDGTYLFLVVVDGRRAGAAGMGLQALAQYMRSLGAYRAINLDGGGSSTMVVQGRVVNRPSDPTGERTVANHLGITWRKGGCAGGLSGVILKANGKPLANALVSVDQGKWKKRTDRRGKYAFAAVSCGTRNVNISGAGFSAKGRNVVVDSVSTTRFDTKLAPAPTTPR
jgi:hypothetical protein